MSLFHNNALIGASGSGGAYNISRSLRFNSADSAHLSRTPASAGNRRTWTWAGWVKRSALATGQRQSLFSSTGASDPDWCEFGFEDGLFYITTFNSANFSSSVYRDASAWYHVVVAFDTTLATASDRATIWINNVRMPITVNIFSQNTDYGINRAAAHNIGNSTFSSRFFAGYLADIHFIDGQALTPTSFGEFSAATGVWMPKAYTGTYGTNGFRLTFADNSAATATTLGKDAAGSNNWTPNNFSVTAGADNDSLVDVPTNGSEVDTGLGGQVRGNYATFNPLRGDGYIGGLSNGNLDVRAAATGNDFRPLSTIGVSSGKWYWEVTKTYAGSSSTDFIVGIANAASTGATYSSGSQRIDPDGTIYGVSIDFDTLTFAIKKDNVALYSTSIAQDTYFAYVNVFFFGAAASATINFGQRPFAYTAPSGFKALCTANLPAPVVTKPSTVMDVALYTGNGTARSITGLGFSPDMVWIKSRSAVGNHRITDIVRGVTKELSPDLTNAEGTDANGVTAFNSDGFSLGISSFQNGSGTTYAAWCWDAGSSTVTDNTGSIQSSRRTNATAGISVVTYNHGSGVGASTIGHGLGVAPSLILSKFRDGTTNWDVYVRALGPGGRLILNSTAAFSSETDPWNNTNPTSTVFSVGPSSWKGVGNHVAYCFAPVAGYSSFGSYIGNGSSDGPFVYTGFRPRWIMVKSSSVGGSPGYDWIIHDTARSTYNLSDTQLIANSSVAENQDSSGASTVGFGWDILSNGFKIRTSTAGRNQSGQTLIYAAFAESPFQYARAR
jgi:hypothetical protein